MDELSSEIVIVLNYIRNTMFFLIPFTLMLLYKETISRYLLRWKINNSRHKSIVDDTPIYRDNTWWIIKSIDEEVKGFVILERQTTKDERNITHAKFMYKKVSVSDFWHKELTYAGKINGDKI